MTNRQLLTMTWPMDDEWMVYVCDQRQLLTMTWPMADELRVSECDQSIVIAYDLTYD